jgi:hypothetical protein
MPSLEATIRVTPDAAISSPVDDPLAATAIAKGAGGASRDTYVNY